MTIISTTAGRNPSEEMEKPSWATKESKMQYLDEISKNDRMISVRFQGKPFNVRSVNQGKLEVVKQEMASVNVNILGISKLKWTGMGEFNSDYLISTTVGRNPSEEME